MRPIVHRAGGGPSHGHRQHAQKLGKDRACDSEDILADRHTRRQTYSSQYFYTTVNFTRYSVTEVGALSAAGWA